MKPRAIVKGKALVFEVDSDGEAPQQLVADRRMTESSFIVRQVDDIKGLIAKQEISNLERIDMRLVYLHVCGT